MWRYIRNFTSVVEGVAARLHKSCRMDERLRNPFCFLENKPEGEAFIRDSIVFSHEKDISTRSCSYVEYSPHTFSKNFNPRNKRRGFEINVNYVLFLPV